MMALFSILAMVMLIAVASNDGYTGAASGYNIPKNECTTHCQNLYGPGWIGVPHGKYGNAFNYCTCMDESFQYRRDNFYR